MSLALDAPAPIGFGEKIWRINWGLALVLTAIAGIGVVALYSAAGGRFDPWAARHAVRYGVAFGIMLVVALMHPKVWLALAWPIYIVSLLLLVAVDVVGKTGMGAQRWLVVGPIQIQPSEITKVAVILVLARYYHGLTREQAARFLYALPPLAVIILTARGSTPAIAAMARSAPAPSLRSRVLSTTRSAQATWSSNTSSIGLSCSSALSAAR